MAEVKFSHVFTREHPGSIDDFYDIDKKKQLGEGSYGKVLKAVKKGTTVVRAIKSINLSGVSEKKRFEEEVAIQQSLDHPNIVKVYEVYRDAKRCYLVMELCTGGELFDRIVEKADDQGHAFSEEDAAAYMKQILGALNYLHCRHFVHRDIKPENFLMENDRDDAQIKVIDFGLAKKYDPQNSPPMKTRAGTPYYVAPEVLKSANGYTEKCDVWSCGVILYILLCGYPPFFGDSDPEIIKMVKKGKFDFPSPDWDGASSASKAFITRMLTMDASKRPSFGELLEDPFLTSKGGGDSKGKVASDLGTRLKNFRGVSKMKKVALTCIAQQLNDSSLEELKNTFRALDVNQDGTLTAKEIVEGMQRHKVSIPEDLTTILKTLDTDGSGVIDYTEFMAATLTTKQYLTDDALWAAFRVFDIDGDGNITREELEKVLSEKENGAEGAAELIREADFNGDGNISFDEFKRVVQGETAKKLLKAV
eukprot:TRINITY_DN8222_c4_g1_i1.p1 TRINITY_DN8222_c4_g1~~TRINITY_DN8222_c4_g1_i1.p1  ORF type:complete len:526 (-),score=133.67 TRINITY_DN8222_c4_g1_i1:160-1593(-)